jgi:hypothetical protein
MSIDSRSIAIFGLFGLLGKAGATGQGATWAGQAARLGR